VLLVKLFRAIRYLFPGGLPTPPEIVRKYNQNLVRKFHVGKYP
jgi:hypothetical protein